MDKEQVRTALCTAIADEQRLQDASFARPKSSNCWGLATGILSTLAVAILGGEPWSKWLAILPGQTSFFVGTERTFAFRSRSGWHCEKRIGLERILLRLDEGVEPAQIRAEMIDLDQRMSLGFPHGDNPDAVVTGKH